MLTELNKFIKILYIHMITAKVTVFENDIKNVKKYNFVKFCLWLFLGIGIYSIYGNVCDYKKGIISNACFKSII